MAKRKRKRLQKLIKVSKPKRLTALQRMTKELSDVATKNGFLVRRGEYLLQQSYHLRLQYDEIRSELAAAQATLVALLENAERLLGKVS